MTGKIVVTYEQGWEYMNHGITKLKSILEGVETSFTSDEYMLLYTKIYDMCTQKPPDDCSERLYEGYGKIFETYIGDTVLPSLREKHAEFLLKACVQRWTNHNVMAKWLGRFFGYLNRYYVTRRAKPSLDEVAVTCFRDMVYNELNGKLCQAVISLIDKEREGELIDRALVKNALDLFLGVQFGGMDCYNSDFEAHMLQDTAVYYSRKASEWILTDTCPEYMVKAEECLKEEKDRVSNYLHSDSEKKLLETAQKELLSVYCKQLIEKENTGCRALLIDGKFNDLSRMFRLFSRIPQGLEPIATMFKDHVTLEGLSLVKQAEEAASSKKPERREAGGAGSQDQEFVRKVIDLHDEYMKYVEGCFQNHTLFHKAIKDAFDVFCNKAVAGCPSAELLATFCDSVIKKGDQSIDETLEKIVKLLAYINDKDLFAEFCKKRLARRLLFDKSSNDQNEIAFLAKLKQQCGGQFTSKMEGMVKDLEVARDNQSQFADQVGSKTAGISFSVTVLTTGFWPSYKSHNLNLPLEMAKCVEVFKEFYHGKSKHRKLSWIHSLGSCNVNARFDMKQMELVVTPFQACALDLFNNVERLSFSEIKNQLNLGEEDVVRVLHSLCCGKYKILIKEPNTTTISPSDYFAYNAKFTDKTKRIKIPLPPVDEKKKTLEDVGKDRRYTIDASLVRIMKARKVLGHQQLVMMCVDQVSKMFKPEIKLIKRRIEDLISRDYLERDNDNPNIFKYVA